MDKKNIHLALDLFQRDFWKYNWELMNGEASYGQIKKWKGEGIKTVHLIGQSAEWTLNPENALRTRFWVYEIDSMQNIGLLRRYPANSQPTLEMTDGRKYTFKPTGWMHWHMKWCNDSGDDLVVTKRRNFIKKKNIGKVMLLKNGLQDENQELLLMLGAHLMIQVFQDGY